MPNEASKSPEMICTLKDMVTASNLTQSSKAKVKKKASHLSNSHQSTQQPNMVPPTSESTK